MKLYYLNDEQKDVTVKILDARYDPAMGTGMIFTKLKPAEGRFFDISLPEGAVLWIKKWKDMVMFSYIDASAIPQLEVLRPVPGEA